MIPQEWALQKRVCKACGCEFEMRVGGQKRCDKCILDARRNPYIRKKCADCDTIITVTGGGHARCKDCRKAYKRAYQRQYARKIRATVAAAREAGIST